MVSRVLTPTQEKDSFTFRGSIASALLSRLLNRSTWRIQNWEAPDLGKIQN